MVGLVTSYHPGRAAQPLRTLNQVLTVAYEVRNVVGDAYRYLSNAVPSASFLHVGNGWTKVTVPARDAVALEQHLKEFFPFVHRRV